MVVAFVDGRTLCVPIKWFPRLAHATAAERNEVEICLAGAALRWEKIDEDILVRGLLMPGGC